MIRAITAIALETPERRASQYVERAWRGDIMAKALTRAAVTQTTQENSGLPLVTKVDILPTVAQMSAAARLFTSCLRVNLDRAYQVAVPRGVSDTLPPFVGEGKPAPAIRCTITDSKVGPVRKILVTSAVTAELESAAAETASDVISHVIAAEVTRRLDGTVFDDVAADDVRPAG